MTLVALVGRLTWDAEIGQLPNDRRIPRLRFTLAVDRDYEVGGETPTDFWPVDVVREYGTWLAPFLTRGRAVLVTRQVHMDERQEKSGQYRVFPDVTVRSPRFLDRCVAADAEHAG